MRLIPRSLLPLLVVSVAGGGRAAADAVPDVPSSALPVAGTCAPMETRDATVIVAGPPMWYRIAGEAGEFQIQDLAARVTRRMAPVAPGGVSTHTVWVVAEKDRPVSVVANLLPSLRPIGIYRVGVQVRSESGEGVMGFPLFLRAGGDPEPTAGATRARRLPVRIARGAATDADPRLLYEAARRASDRFGPVVAEVSVHASIPLQSAVTALDMLHRGGCAAVRVLWTGMGLPRREPPGLRIHVTDWELDRDGAGVEVPAIRARKEPWGMEGANAPGSEGWVLEEISGPGSDAATPADEGPFPAYSASPGGVPESRLRAAGEALIAWARAAERDLDAGLRGRPLARGRLAVRHALDPAKAAALLAPARQAFPAPERVRTSNVRVEAYLFDGARASGKVDVTVHLGGNVPSVVFARWVAEQMPEGLTLPPVAVDPFSSRVPGQLRVWLEGLLHGVRRDGAAGVPLAPEAEVLSFLPAVAHAGLKAPLARRAADAELLARWVRGTRFDRVLVAGVEASAAVVVEGRVAGVLLLGLESEEAELRIGALRAKAAPR